MLDMSQLCMCKDRPSRVQAVRVEHHVKLVDCSLSEARARGQLLKLYPYLPIAL